MRVWLKYLSLLSSLCVCVCVCRLLASSALVVVPAVQAAADASEVRLQPDCTAASSCTSQHAHARVVRPRSPTTPRPTSQPLTRTSAHTGRRAHRRRATISLSHTLHTYVSHLFSSSAVGPSPILSPPLPPPRCRAAQRHSASISRRSDSNNSKHTSQRRQKEEERKTMWLLVVVRDASSLGCSLLVASRAGWRCSASRCHASFVPSRLLCRYVSAPLSSWVDQKMTHYWEWAVTLLPMWLA